tara:strand:+ start:293 stop:1207 length:915 start_codon:yes stop_codon:yes gene_type:complete
MANWREIIISGSDAHLNSLNTETSLTASGLIYPNADGTNEQVIQTDGSGNLSFVDKDSGAQGAVGAQGITGIQGTDGAQGTNGLKGEDGAQGTSGDKGQKGEVGVQGLDGTQGTNGAKGELGAQGVSGDLGSKGDDGAQGTTGGAGPVGGKGEKGDLGAQGITGIQGTDGAQGLTGIQGTDGSFGGATFDYTFSTDTAGGNDPGQGIVELNSSTQNSSDEMYIDATDDNGTNINSFLSTIDAATSAIKGHVRISNRTDATQFLLFQITDLTVQNTDQWWVIDITNQAYLQTLHLQIQKILLYLS